MLKYKVRESRDNGTRPAADPAWLDMEEELLITKVVSEIVTEDHLKVLAFNICGDHMHLLLVCEEDEVTHIMQKIKSKTARAVNIHRGITFVTKQQTPEVTMELTPLLQQKRGETQHSLWTQKFGCKEIMDEAQLWNTIEYIKTNRNKHGLPPLERGSISPTEQQGSMLPCLYQNYEATFRKEYKGGFDVVIGNPPYGAKFSEAEISFYRENFKVVKGHSEAYYLFFE
jgi:REP element-mobilizing transposase RayT